MIEIYNRVFCESIEAALQRCSENIKQMYRRTHKPRCDFNKQLYWNRTALRHECSPVNLLHTFIRNTLKQLQHLFIRTHHGGLLLKVVKSCLELFSKNAPAQIFDEVLKMTLTLIFKWDNITDSATKSVHVSVEFFL